MSVHPCPIPPTPSPPFNSPRHSSNMSAANNNNKLKNGARQKAKAHLQVAPAFAKRTRHEARLKY
ncbi:GD21182 [Drosophila simulans]|uniref:GD21182 n=1 Tax=Drosophila simulans TaxID=7240 RepID=B4QUC5_DROSI|nr:GD21182 [Drosophila simulans]